MAKEILIYGSLYNWNNSDTLRYLDEANAEDVTLRINSDGGSPEDTFGVIAKMLERKANGKKTTIKVDGKAYSTAAFMLTYFTDVEALDVSAFLLHRAAYPEWYEKGDQITSDQLNYLKWLNDKLKDATKAKINEAKLIELKGVTIDAIFDQSNRLDVRLTADEALQIGLISKITKITPEIEAYVNSNVLRIAAEFKVSAPAPTPTATQTVNPKTTNMNIEQLKAQHPALFAEVQTLAVTAERDRVGAWMAFADVDPKAVAEGIKTGASLSATAMAELTRKSMSAEALANIAATAAPAATTTEKPVVGAAPTAEEKELEVFRNSVKTQLTPTA